MPTEFEDGAHSESEKSERASAEFNPKHLHIMNELNSLPNMLETIKLIVNLFYSTPDVKPRYSGELTEKQQLKLLVDPYLVIYQSKFYQCQEKDPAKRFEALSHLLTHEPDKTILQEAFTAAISNAVRFQNFLKQENIKGLDAAVYTPQKITITLEGVGKKLNPKLAELGNTITVTSNRNLILFEFEDNFAAFVARSISSSHSENDKIKKLLLDKIVETVATPDCPDSAVRRYEKLINSLKDENIKSLQALLNQQGMEMPEITHFKKMTTDLLVKIDKKFDPNGKIHSVIENLAKHIPQLPANEANLKMVSQLTTLFSELSNKNHNIDGMLTKLEQAIKNKEFSKDKTVSGQTLLFFNLLLDKCRTDQNKQLVYTANQANVRVISKFQGNDEAKMIAKKLLVDVKTYGDKQPFTTAGIQRAAVTNEILDHLSKLNTPQEMITYLDKKKNELNTKGPGSNRMKFFSSAKRSPELPLFKAINELSNTLKGEQPKVSGVRRFLR